MTPKFKIGDWVFKREGTYQATGRIVAITETSLGEVRYLFEFDLFPGMLHVFGESQLQLVENFKDETDTHLMGVAHTISNILEKLGFDT